MATVRTWLVLLLAGVASARAGDRIAGGEPALIEKYPSLVQVEFFGVFSGIWSQSCAATTLNTRFVLSAAQCFSGILYQPAHRRIRAGTTDRNLGGVVVYVEREYNHPSYGLRGNDGDITVVRLRSPLVFNPVIQPGVIVSLGDKVPDNIPVVHAGWGATSEFGISSPVLLDTLVFTVNNAECARRYEALQQGDSGIVTENMICTGLLDVGGRDACQGDAGGPLYFQNIVIGVVSWGHGCANATFPRVNTAVSSYTDWIVATASS